MQPRSSVSTVARAMFKVKIMHRPSVCVCVCARSTKCESTKKHKKACSTKTQLMHYLQVQPASSPSIADARPRPCCYNRFSIQRNVFTISSLVILDCSFKATLANALLITAGSAAANFKFQSKLRSVVREPRNLLISKTKTSTLFFSRTDT